MTNEFFEHSKETWTNVLSGHSSIAEKLEVGAEIGAGVVALAALSRVGLSKLSNSAFAVAKAEAQLPTLNLLGSGEKLAPALAKEAPAIAEESWTQLAFSRTQRIQLRGSETGAEVHERLRSQVVNSFRTIHEPTEISTPSWYTFDASKTLGIDNAVAVMTSTCKHETPSMTFVGIRKPGSWMNEVPSLTREPRFQYKLHPLGRELSSQEKNAIYDRM